MVRLVFGIVFFLALVNSHAQVDSSLDHRDQIQFGIGLNMPETNYGNVGEERGVTQIEEVSNSIYIQVSSGVYYPFSGLEMPNSKKQSLGKFGLNYRFDLGKKIYKNISVNASYSMSSSQLDRWKYVEIQPYYLSIEGDYKFSIHTFQLGAAYDIKWKKFLIQPNAQIGISSIYFPLAHSVYSTNPYTEGVSKKYVLYSLNLDIKYLIQHG